MIHTECAFEGKALENVYELLGELGDGKEAERAITHVLNRVAVGARADIVKAIPQLYEVRARDVREAIKIKKARFEDLRAEVHSRGSVIELFDFKHSPEAHTKPAPPVGVRVKVRKDKPGGRIPGTFLLKGHEHIFQRTNPNDKRYFTRLYGPAIPSMMDVVLGEEGQQGIQDKAGERMVRELGQQLDYMLTKGAK